MHQTNAFVSDSIVAIGSFFAEVEVSESSVNSAEGDAAVDTDNKLALQSIKLKK